MSEPADRVGTVMRVDARVCEVDVEGESFQASLRGRLFEEKTEDQSPLAVGDRVQLTRKEEGLAVESVQPRRNFLARRASGAEVRRQVIAANVDQVVIVCSFGNPGFSSIATDRILVSASFHDVPAAIVLNKADLAEDLDKEQILRTYERAGYRTLLTSAAEGAGLDEFRELLRDRTSVLSGLSGVGKSTLLNAIEPGLGLRTREVSRSLKSGRHTTTFACMFPLAMGGAVIDTPGVRVFRIYGLPPTELRLHFPEMERLGTACRFPNCSHRHEPGCAITAARESNEFPESRYRSYIEILEELERIYGGAGPAPA